jgi:hypothetical protein
MTNFLQAAEKKQLTQENGQLSDEITLLKGMFKDQKAQAQKK